MEGWWLDERAHAGEEHLDAAYVASYDRKANYDPAGDVAALQRHGLDANSSVVDLGAGTGTFTTAVASVCRHVLAVDVSPVMVAAIRARVHADGLDNASVEHSGFLSYEHAGEPVDFVFTRNALHHLPDFWKAIALDRIRAILRPGGILHVRDLVFDFEPAEAADRIRTWMAGAVADPALGYTASEFATHVREEDSTYSWLFEVMLARAGFEILERDIRGSVYATYTCRQAPR